MNLKLNIACSNQLFKPLGLPNRIIFSESDDDDFDFVMPKKKGSKILSDTDSDNAGDFTPNVPIPSTPNASASKGNLFFVQFS